jgi:hypothetical protein
LPPLPFSGMRYANEKIGGLRPRPSAEMSHTNARVRHFEWVVGSLLTACVALLTVCAAVTWFYLSDIREDINAIASNQAAVARILLAIKEQQAALREELHALNKKASIAADVSPPPRSGTSP